MNKKNKADYLKRKEPIDLPLTDGQKAVIFACALRAKSLSRAAQSRLDMQTDFRGSDRAFGLLWRAATKLYDSSGGELPDLDLLAAEAESLLKDAVFEDVSDEDLVVTCRTLDLARGQTAKSLKSNLPFARKLLKQHLTEGTLRRLKDKLNVPGVDLTSVVETLNAEHDKIRSVAASGLKPPFPAALEQIKPLRKISTGCSHLDYYMGGQAANEVYGFLAPYGGGKTTQAVQLCVESCLFEHARQNIARAFGVPYRPKVVYFVTYEEDLASLRHRFLTYAALVDKNSIEDGLWDDMSRQEKQNYKPYEQEMFSWDSDAEPMPGEWERLHVAMKLLNQRLRIIDFTGARPEYAAQAADLARGLAEVIAADQEEQDNPGVAMLVMDYAGAAADRHCEYTGSSPDKAMRHFIGRLPHRVKNHIAVPFACPVWIMHQLSTKANERGAGHVPKPTDVSEAKNFFENMNYGFMLGTKTKDQLAILTNGKQRRSEARQDKVVRIDGKFSRILDTNHDYRIDQGKIVPAKDYALVAEDDDDDDLLEPKVARNGANYPISRFKWR